MTRLMPFVPRSPKWSWSVAAGNDFGKRAVAPLLTVVVVPILPNWHRLKPAPRCRRHFLGCPNRRAGSILGQEGYDAGDDDLSSLRRRSAASRVLPHLRS